MIEAFATLDAAWPWGAALLAGLTLLYLLEPRRRQLQVPFGALWQSVLLQVEARRLGRRWRRILSWLAMVAVAAALWAALAERPLGLHAWRARAAPPTRHTIVIVDVSASMATRDGHIEAALLPRSRLDEARERLGAIWAQARPGERFLLLSAAAGVRTQGPWSADVGPLREAAQRLGATDAALDLDRALRAAADALQGRSLPSVIVVTDGGPSQDGALPSAAKVAGVAVQWLLVGPAGQAPAQEKAATGAKAAPAALANLATVQVGVRSHRADPGRGVVQALVRNDSASEVNARVVLCSRAEGSTVADFDNPAAVVAEQTLVLPARGSRVVRFDAVDLAGGRFAVQVRAADLSTFVDLAPQDDWGFAVAAQRRRLGVLWVGGDNLFLEAALVANERFEVKRIRPDAYDPNAFSADRRLAHGIDVVLLEQVAKPAPPGMPVLRFDLRGHADARPTDPRALSGPSAAADAPNDGKDAGPADAVASSPGVRPPLELSIAATDHPLMRGVSLHDANIDLIRPLQVGAGAVPLIIDRDQAAIAVADDAGVRRLDIGFDLLETDLGGRYLLPLLLANAIDWLAGDESPVVAALEVGRPWAIGAPVRGVSWTWQEPGQAATPARTSADALLATSERHGIHAFRSDSGLELARPTLSPATERPDRVGAPLPRWQPERAAAASEAEPSGPWSAWALLVAAAAFGLWIEWGLFQRRRTV